MKINPLYVAAVGTATSAIYCALVVCAALRFKRRRAKAYALSADFAPPVSLLKPLHGAEPGLDRNLESFFNQRYAGEYEILFCARHEDDAGLTLARSIAARHPSVNARFITCGEPQFPNPKMYSLAVMTGAAAHDLLVTSDADARVAPDYLARCVQELARPGADLASCLYIGMVDKPSLPLRLDALGKSVEMSSGVLVADMLSGTDFALGVTMILRKQAFQRLAALPTWATTGQKTLSSETGWPSAAKVWRWRRTSSASSSQLTASRTPCATSSVGPKAPAAPGHGATSAQV